MSNLSAGANTWTPPTTTAPAPPAGSPTPASSLSPALSEKEEAAAIVAQAQKDLEQRKADADKVKKGMSKEELQALINAKTKR
ncbi:hypothetical protein TrVE_jg6330 [Triparma verrucosa]|uniref:Uncharacterized protein n=1 Tax=Triparma verrucosa TaxID=1606542 RepID=A0A9W7BV56_9STRA|nr:hypothetical protein TrVE_jg6330 [Triparma verrucosa]|mmetsp:Transcript_11554/g.21042  ORF Transcript_11554/g.21042 Transcript_11554/m.21042 type:complete len:83 (-) Transcript_11554:74-322(-)|eukprot:CAMPEP_0182491116 /NCGR_PEP_ID=MMETSP1321-20130603/708_1 /TAXON_ID=91990 /ORGANISM="Bolidomonas sp., Strain RCC1657" /LENGTH=82 /DNA_ID=CAMNT_0024693371 /DNA_START=63 /DNA_END=311 /DNA_ORIENTATION=-